MSLNITRNTLLQVVRKDQAGRTVRISNYLKTSKSEKPVSEQINYSDGRSTLYMYNETGDRIEHVARFEKVSDYAEGL